MTGLYQKLKQHIDQPSDTGGNCLFYLAVADRFFGPVVTQLGKAGLFEENWDQDGKAPEHWRRVVIEKPFGHDEASARSLNACDPALRGGASDLPDRPFPRQGDGAEHHGAAFRQRDVRADLEP